MGVRLATDPAFEESKPTLSLSSTRNIVEPIFLYFALPSFGEELLDVSYAVLDLLIVCFRFRAEFQRCVVHHLNSRSSSGVEGTELVFIEGEYFQDFWVQVSRNRVLEQGVQRCPAVHISLGKEKAWWRSARFEPLQKENEILSEVLRVEDVKRILTKDVLIDAKDRLVCIVIPLDQLSEIPHLDSSNHQKMKRGVPRIIVFLEVT